MSNPRALPTLTERVADLYQEAARPRPIRPSPGIPAEDLPWSSPDAGAAFAKAWEAGARAEFGEWFGMASEALVDEVHRQHGGYVGRDANRVFDEQMKFLRQRLTFAFTKALQKTG